MNAERPMISIPIGSATSLMPEIEAFGSVILYFKKLKIEA